MNNITESLQAIEARKVELLAEVGKPETTTERMSAIKTEAEKLNTEAAELRSQQDLEGKLQPVAVPQARKIAEDVVEKRAAEFRTSNKLSIEVRSLLSTGTIATPTAVGQGIGEMPDMISSIVDDVEAIDATGTGSWKFAYKKTDAAAADVTDGAAIGGTDGTYDFVTINPAEWGILSTISAQVAKMTNVPYLSNIQSGALVALRKVAKAKIVTAVLASTLLETRKGIALDATYLRNVVLNFGADESVGGGTKLYLCKADLATLGAVRGTNEKKAVFDITFTDENNGTIKDGGLSVPFSLLSNLEAGVQLYGQPRSIKMPMWGAYEVTTDQGGKYFEQNLMAIRGLATANADLAVLHGMQKIMQASA